MTTMTKKIILVASLEAGRKILSQNKELESLLLVSDPAITPACGIGYFSMLFKVLSEEFPQTPFLEGVACGQDPGLVFAAIRHKIPVIFFDSTSLLWPKIESLIQNAGLTLYPQNLLKEGHDD